MWDNSRSVKVEDSKLPILAAKLPWCSPIFPVEEDVIILTLEQDLLTIDTDLVPMLFPIWVPHFSHQWVRDIEVPIALQQVHFSLPKANYCHLSTVIECLLHLRWHLWAILLDIAFVLDSDRISVFSLARQLPDDMVEMRFHHVCISAPAFWEGVVGVQPNIV